MRYNKFLKLNSRFWTAEMHKTHGFSLYWSLYLTQLCKFISFSPPQGQIGLSYPVISNGEIWKNRKIVKSNFYYFLITYTFIIYEYPLNPTTLQIFCLPVGLNFAIILTLMSKKCAKLTGRYVTSGHGLIAYSGCRNFARNSQNFGNLVDWDEKFLDYEFHFSK